MAKSKQPMMHLEYAVERSRLRSSRPHHDDDNNGIDCNVDDADGANDNFDQSVVLRS